MNRTASAPATLALSSAAYLSTEFDAIVDRFRPAMPLGFVFHVTASSVEGEVRVHTNDADLAGRIVAALEGRPATVVRRSANHPTVDLPAHLEGPRLPTTFDPAFPFGRDFDCCATGSHEGVAR